MNETRRPGSAFLIKIIPPHGYNVYRLHVSRVAVATACVELAIVVLGALGVHAWQLHVAEENVRALESRTSAQDAKLSEIDREAAALADQLHDLQRQNAAIRRLLGTSTAPAPAPSHAAVAVPPPGAQPSFSGVAARLAAVTAASAATGLDESRLERLTHRVLNLRRLAQIARARMLAAIPSINPVGGGIASAFGYRLDPWPEFHEGVDLEADYGTPVHASADGVVAGLGWDGGFGNKVDVDHGNGYHSWYAHLSRFAVAVGEHVRRGQIIAFVGATGDATGPHLHYQLMLEGKAIDPAPFLNGIPRQVVATLHPPSRVQ